MTRFNVTEDTSTPLLITKIMEGINNLVTTEELNLKMSEPTLPLCDEMPPDLGKCFHKYKNYHATTTFISLERIFDDCTRLEPESALVNWTTFRKLNCLKHFLKERDQRVDQKKFLGTFIEDFYKQNIFLRYVNVYDISGPILVNKNEMELDYVETKYPEVHSGGRYSPPNCTARHKVAIIVPYRWVFILYI